MKVSIPNGASSLIYTLDGNDPRQSNTARKTDKELDLAGLLANSPNVKVAMRAVDQDGNFSDAVYVELVSKERKYAVLEKRDVFGGQEITLKGPDDMEGLLAVLKSVIKYGVKKNLLSASKAQKLETALRDLIEGE